MNTSTTPPGDSPDDQDLAALLRAAGPREQASADVEAQVRAAVAAEWRATVAARQQKTRMRPWLAVASIATVAMAAWLAQPLLQRDAGPVAAVALVTGSVQVRHADGTDWEKLGLKSAIRQGDTLQTSAAGRLALRWPDGMQVRLDNESELLVADAGSARLDTGAVYVDSGTGTPAAADVSFVLQTAAGTVRHLGTQYAVRTTRNGAVQVSVREGSVAIEHGHDRLIGTAGEQLSLLAGGDVVRTNLSPHDAQWAWVQTVTPAFAIEDRPLDAFLTWAARETGRQLVYTSRDAADAAASIRLRGSVAGLTPDAAVAAIATTTPSLQVVLAESQIRVARASQ